MSQIKCHQASFSFGDKPILDHVSFSIDHRDRIVVLGRNGAGKSTLFKLIEGEFIADEGSIERGPITIAKMEQSVPRDLNGTVLDYVLEGHINDDEWQQSHQAQAVISKLGLEEQAELNHLSGGQIRRVLLAKALVNEPDILLLDEPTNHLDIDSILWLEHFIQQYPKTVITITHDRAFMQSIATRIFELDLGKMIDWHGSYHDFLKHKEHVLHAEALEHAKFDKKLAAEEVWIRQGIKARRTRNEGRVRALKAMRQQRTERLSRDGKLNIEQQRIDYSGKQVIEINNLGVDYQNQTLIDQFTAMVLRGDKIGIIGHNGSGKSTLIKALLGETKPDRGTIKTGSNLKVAYFDQHRAQLDPSKTAMDAIAEGREFIDINGKRKHIISYLQDFLFTPEKARSLVSSLSGGERNRLMLASILAKPSNLLILDEPTNDLDQETLELLEEFLLDYQGTLLLVSHDRALLNNVVTSTWVFEANGHIQEYIGGYDDWQRQKKQRHDTQPKTDKTQKTTEKKTKPKKLGYMEQRELNALPDKISELENAINAMQNRFCEPNYYQQDNDIIQADKAQLAKLESELETAFERWEYLENKQ